MTGLERRELRGLFPELLDFLESPFTAFRPTAGQAIRVEDYVADNTYVIRAELPGIHPDKDVELTISGGILTIKAERHEEQKEGHRSEFRYGSYTRSLALPDKVKPEDITATYTNGILEITVPLPAAKREVHRVTVAEKD